MTEVQPLIGFGRLHHARARPKQHKFGYSTYFLMLPMTSLQNGVPNTSSWTINSAGVLSFYETDHGDGRAPSHGGVISWLDTVLSEHGIFDATGEAWLQTYRRVLGFSFKPVSFWYCHRAPNDQGGALRATVAEVNSTFGKRHWYVLDAARYGINHRADKAFRVSPFNPVDGYYHFHFLRRQEIGRDSIVAQIDYFDDNNNESATLRTSISGTLYPMCSALLRRAAWRYPFLTIGVLLHIHLQALRLWIIRVPLYKREETEPTQQRDSH